MECNNSCCCCVFMECKIGDFACNDIVVALQKRMSLRVFFLNFFRSNLIISLCQYEIATLTSFARNDRRGWSEAISFFLQQVFILCFLSPLGFFLHIYVYYSKAFVYPVRNNVVSNGVYNEVFVFQRSVCFSSRRFQTARGIISCSMLNLVISP